MISFLDALGGYFASRILGFQVLEGGGILDKYIEAIRKAYSQGGKINAVFKVLFIIYPLNLSKAIITLSHENKLKSCLKDNSFLAIKLDPSDFTIYDLIRCNNI